MAFDDRIGASGPFEELVEDYLNRMGIKGVFRYGSEHTHLEFANLVRTQTDPVSKQIRFKPDGIGIDDLGSFYWEAKTTMNSNAQTIECDAYENYMSLYRQGARLKLF